MAKDEPGEDQPGEDQPDEGAASAAMAAPPSEADPVAPTSADIEAQAALEAAPAPEAEPVPVLAPTSTTPVPPQRRASRLWWALPILLVVELYVYGLNGRVEVCVGKEGDTDFTLMGQERTDENRWKFPRCEIRENLGLRSQYDARVEEATKAACRGATIFRNQGEAKACAAQEAGWQHRVDGHFVPPWDPSYYRHLLWFLY